MEDQEKVESFRDDIERRLYELEQTVNDIKSKLDSQPPPKGDT